VTALLIGVMTLVVYDAGATQGAAAVGGLGLMLALAIGVAWASNRDRAGR
jgi:hypothetical protein